MIHLLNDDARRDPYPLYAHLRAASPVLHDRASGLWMLFGHDAVKRALSDAAAFSSAVTPGTRPGQWFIFADPPRHTQLRALVMRAFTPRTVAALEPRIRELARGLLDARTADGGMELVGDFAAPLPLMVIAEMLGAPADEWPRLRAWSEGIVNLIQTLRGGEAGERAIAVFMDVHAEMAAYVAELLQARRAAPRDDLLTRLVQAEVEGARLTEEEIVGFFQLLLLAGNETTTNLIANAVLCLVENPDQVAMLRAVPDLLPAAVEEVLRYRSPVQAMFRVTRREVEVGGQTIPAGKLVLAMIGSANRDPSCFRDADRFDAGRTPNPHIAFGHGIHFCLGAPLARLEARVALEELLARADRIRLADETPWEPRAAFHVHGPSRLPIRFDPRAPSAERLARRTEPAERARCPAHAVV
jgi:cytochrome P450